MTGYDYTRQLKDKIAESPTHTLSLRDALDYINFYGLNNLFNATGDMRFVGQVAIDILDKTLSESKCNVVSDIEPLPYQSKSEPLTIDEAISHCLEVVERNKKEAVDSWYSEGIFDSCAQCAEDHQQLADWLKELKELRNSIGAVKLSNMKEAVRLLQELNDENNQIASQLTEAKRLLKLAVEQMAEVGAVCDCICSKNCPLDECGKFTFHDEIIKLIES